MRQTTFCKCSTIGEPLPRECGLVPMVRCVPGHIHRAFLRLLVLLSGDDPKPVLDP